MKEYAFTLIFSDKFSTTFVYSETDECAYRKFWELMELYNNADYVRNAKTIAKLEVVVSEINDNILFYER